ncbi:MAG TPA: hypothetical protein VGK84_04050 [Candidatus Tumulicola sp.]|jgi:hypothetical protein
MAAWTDGLASSVIAAVVSSSVVTALVQSYFGAKLERQRAGWERELQDVTAEQTRLTNRLQATFSELQTERARVIKDLYARIVRVEIILNEITLSKAVDETLSARFHSAVAQFVDYYLPNRIWLPVEISDQVGELRSTYFSMQKQLAGVPPGSFDDNLKKGLIVVTGATRHTLEEVSASFRALLGAEMLAV